MAERHRAAHTRSSWTTARLCDDRAGRADRQRHVPGVNALRDVDRARERHGRRPALKKPIACDAATSRSVPAQRFDVVTTSGAHGDLRHLADARLPGRECVVGGRGPRAAARGRYAADVRPEARGRIAAAHEPPEEHRFLRRRDAGVDGAAEVADEADVDRAARELGVEAADDEALRTRELELDLPRRGEHPRARDRHADLEATALVRRVRGSGRSDGGGRDDGVRTSSRLTEPASGTRARRGRRRRAGARSRRPRRGR